MYVCVPVKLFPAHDRPRMTAKLTEAGYSVSDFPVPGSKWNETVAKRVKITDKCATTHSFPPRSD